MADVKKIALVINAANFERHQNIVKAVHEKLKKLGNYALYVFTNYAMCNVMAPYDVGEVSVYQLIEEMQFDGCIIEGNTISNQELLEKMVARMKDTGIPFVIMNYKAKGVPFFLIDSYEAACLLLEHLITEHDCRKINLVTDGQNEIGEQSTRAYEDTLRKYHIPLEEKRHICKTVSIPNDREIYHEFKRLGTMDADAVLCTHDVGAIGLYLELKEQGISVPKKVKLCSLNRSVNSIVFRPDITGANRRDRTMAEQAAQAVHDLLNGKSVPYENYVQAKIYIGESCGCAQCQSRQIEERYQNIILGKIEAGSQISQMMRYNDALEEVDSLDKLGENIKELLQGIHCEQFFCCLNQRDLSYIVSADEKANVVQKNGKVYDDTMVVLCGDSARTGKIQNHRFSLQELVPVEPEGGDMFVFYPIHHKDRVFGYNVILNSNIPIEVYNYRICHESICSSIENLHRQMMLRGTIVQLDELHMRDAMTGLYNRFALERFSPDFAESGSYTVAMADMDGLKKINDTFGHLAGNHAICIVADTIKEAMEKGSMVIRYGGDEFIILAHETELEYWERIKEEINGTLAMYVDKEALPYQLGTSIGYAFSTKEEPLTIEKCLERADQAMYEEKRQRRVMRD